MLSGDYVDMAEASRILGVPVTTLRTWRARNRGPMSFKCRGRILYDTHDLHSWFARERYESLRGGF